MTKRPLESGSKMKAEWIRCLRAAMTEEVTGWQVRGAEARKGKQKCWCHCLWANFY